MAYITGADGAVKIGANTVANVRSFTLDIGGNLEDTTALGASWDGQTPTTGRATGTIECDYDNTDTNGQVALQTAAINRTIVSLLLYVDNNNYWTIPAYLTLGLNVAAKATQKATFNFTSSGTCSYT
jgi:hypothetical protein